VVTYDSGAVEVCYGGITKARVQAHMVPYPRHGSISLDPTMWPIIKVRLERQSGSNTSIISVHDALNNDFGSIDASTAAALAPLMDAHVVRIQARILMRKKKPGEQPGQAASEFYDLSVNLYGKRRDSTHIGKFLGQKNVWLQAPLGVETGIPTEILHLPRPQSVVKTGLTQGYVTRTVEEIRSDVIGVFDSLHKSDKLPEMDADPRILTPLLSHQKQGLYFMTMKEKERLYGGNDMDRNSLWKLRIRNGQRSYYNVITSNEVTIKPPDVLGGILADMMGLGKTLSILSLVISTLNDSNEWAKKKPPPRKTTEDPHLIRNSKSTLLVAPLSTISNWEEQISTHIKPGALSYYIYHGGNRINDVNELAKFDMVITTYSVVASEQRNKATRNGSLSPLEHTNWFRIVLDEAHMIREQSTKQSQAICRLCAHRRWAVTGTPVQNRLDDLGALIKFLRIKPFDDKKGFTEFILSPFKNANPEILPKLRLLVDSVTLRRLKDRIDLPPRRDEIIRLEFNDEERSLYEWFAKDSNNKMRVITTQQKNGLGSKTYAHVLRAILRLRLICAHGKDLLSEEDLKATEGWSRQNAIDLSDDDDDDDGERSGLTPAQAFEMYELIKQTNGHGCNICGRKAASDDLMVDETANSKDETIGFMTHCYQIFCKDCVPNFRKKVLENMSPDKHVSCPLCGQWIKPSLFELKQGMIDDMEEKKLAASSNPRHAKQFGSYKGPHTKTRALTVALLQSQALSAQNPSEPPIKSVVFSGWTSHLDLIQIALEDNNISYTRLDGKMTRPQRTAALDSFRDDPSITVILVSLTAGGLGLNLTAASHVYVMEPQFNPAAEAQAVDRVHRLGQKRPVTTTRFIMSGSFEEKMLELQRKKQNLADLSMSKEKLDKGEAVKRKLEELRSLFK
jgi:SNF2 family DNA or RNA helicase